jgi:hypothetical protein
LSDGASFGCGIGRVFFLTQTLFFSLIFPREMAGQDLTTDEHWIDRIWDAYIRLPSDEKKGD